MRFSFLCKLTLYVLTLDGLAALYLTDLVSRPALAAVAVAMGASWWTDRLRPFIPNYRRLWDLITLVFLGYAALDFTVLAPSFMAAVVHLVLFLLMYKLYNARNHRDLLDIVLLTFLMLVLACLLTTSFGLLLVFCLYMILGVWGFILLHLRREAEIAMPERSREALAAPGFITPGFLCSSLGVAVASLALTLVIFFLIPRLGRTFFPLTGQFGALATGFTDRVELGSYGVIQNDPTIVMRVSFPEEVGMPERLLHLRWRGVSFDHFDGRTWTLADTAREQVRRVREGHYAVAPHIAGAPFLSYEVFLEPIGTEVLFGLPRVTAIQGRLPGVAVNTGGGLVLPTPPMGRLRYYAISQPERVREEWLRRRPGVMDYPQPIRKAYLQLPSISPRVLRLARDLAKGAATPLEIARRVESYLTNNLRYSLDLGKATDLDPIDEFLFGRKTGNCEYFAAAMAVLLRSAGVPARVVNGFQRGEWNEVGRYFAVRQRDAHSWVEVYLTEAGWVTFDPSPRAAFESGVLGISGRFAQHLDALRMRWNRYVVDYSVGDQALVAMELRRQSIAFRGRLALLWDRWSFKIRRTLRIAWRDYGYVAAGVVAFVAALVVLFRRVPPAQMGPAWVLRGRFGQTPAFYGRMLRLLARRGRPRAPGATAREFLTSLSDRPQIHVPAEELTSLYERVRFGGEVLSVPARARANTLLKQLEGAAR